MGKRNGCNGRPKIEIDWKRFEAYCAFQCTLEEIAMYFNCSAGTIERRVKEQYQLGFSEVFQRARQSGLMSLRQNLFRMSEKQPTVAIFLAKNWLGMTEKQEITGEGGGPVKHEIIVVSEAAKKATQEILNGEGT